ncbi:MAG: methyltransferase domain-containing protein [Rivularia sp. (in: cyanobacteria)]
MIESNNPEINVDELMDKIREEVAQRNNNTQQSLFVNSNNAAKINFNFNYLEALLRNAETRADVRTKWPDKLNRFPFTLSEKIKKYCLKIVNFIFKDQREVNLNLVNALKQSTLLNRQLVTEVELLRSQFENHFTKVDILNRKIDVSLNDNTNTELQSYLDGINRKIERIDNKYKDINNGIELIDRNIENLDRRVNTLEQENQKTPLSIPNFIEFSHDSYLTKAIALSRIPIEEHCKYENKDLFYYLFENVFYNSQSVKEKQKYYLKYINQSSISHPFLDAGCGRGEFMENLKSNDIQCQGIDLNELEIQYLKQSGYDVYKSDIIDFLKKSNDKFSGISALQVLEHLNFEYLNSFLKLAFEKIVVDGVIILETINPHSLYGLSNFYQDPTHIKPLPPEMLIFLLEWHGFKEIKTIYSSLIPKTLHVFSEQIMHYQDYALVGYKK